MITFDFLQKIHRLVDKIPERREEFEILYPEAFKKTDITDEVRLNVYGQLFKIWRLYDGDYCFAEMKPFVQTLQVFDSRRDDPKERKVCSLNCPIESGYEIEFKAGGSYGFRIWRYGEKKDVVNLEFRPTVEKNRIKEKD